MRHRAGGCGTPGSPTHRGSGREARRAHPPGRGAGGTCEPSCSSPGRSAALSACTPHLRGGPVGTVRRHDRTAPLRVFEPRPEVRIHCPGSEVRVHVELLNATLFRDRVFGGVTDREMRSLRVRVGPRSNSPSTLVGRGIFGRRDTGAQRARRGGQGRGRRVAAGGPGSPATTGRSERGEAEAPPDPAGGADRADTSILVFWTSEPRENTLLLL